jgi:FAD/FMN-containing dehydrogenase
MDFENALAEIVGPADVLSDPELKASYELDYTGRFGAPARLVVRPADAAAVAAVVGACASVGAPIVPRAATPGSSARASRAAARSCSRSLA